LKKNQSTKINLIGCDTIVNSPSFSIIVTQSQHQHDKFLVGRVPYSVNTNLCRGSVGL
jgi:hypothetical protein